MERTKLLYYWDEKPEVCLKKVVEAPFGTCVADSYQALITESGVYVDHGVRKNGDPNHLGFAGQWWIVLHTIEVPSKFGGKQWVPETDTWVPAKDRIRKCYVTNNLFHINDFPKGSAECLKDKINAKLFSLGEENLKEIKDQLESLLS